MLPFGKIETLRWLTLSVIGLILVALILVTSLTFSFILTQSISKLEHQYVADHSDRVQRALIDETNRLGSSVTDWGPWDETYDFIENTNKEYIDINLVDDTFINLNINMMTFINDSGQVVFSKTYDPANSTMTQIPRGLKEQLKKSSIIDNKNPKFKAKGIICLQDRSILIASHPILTSDYKGPMRGNVVVGRFLDASEVRSLSDKLKLAITIHMLGNKRNTPYDLVSSDEPVVFEEISDDSIAGYSTIKDIYGNPALGLRVETARGVHEIGQRAIGYMLYALFVIGIIFSIVVLVFLEKHVLSRLSALSASVKSIGDQRSFTAKLPVGKRNDEISVVSQEINNMLHKLDESQQIIKKSRDELELILESTDQGIFGVDADGLCTFFNSAALRMTGFSHEDVIGKNIHELIHHNRTDGTTQYCKCDCSIHKVLSEGRGIRTDEELMWTKTGGSFPIEQSCHPIIENGKVTGAVATFIDITERKNLEDQLSCMAFYDSLTGLPNRLMMSKRLNQAIANALTHNHKIAVMIVDLDNFKLVNDTYGHDHGDAYLQFIAVRLLASLREGDTLARLGGDEFAIILPSLTDDKEAIRVAEKVIDALKQPVLIEGKEHYTTASIGISCYPEDGENQQSLLKNADVALYCAKESGKSSHKLYTLQMQERVLQNVEMENDLRNALEFGEFLLHYQPQVSLSSGKILGMEALIRWQHPSLGMISPIKFIPIAEESDLIVQIGQWVLLEACWQNKMWQSNGHRPMRVSVNLSPKQFQKDDMLSTVNEALSLTGLDPEFLELEITESAVMQNIDEALDKLNELKNLGVSVAFDDFGTGFSSLGNLKKLPVDRLKIDRSFIKNIQSDPDDRAISKAIIEMARNMELVSIAEGVETILQLEILHLLHCDEIQGFLFSQPLPAEEAINLLSQEASWFDLCLKSKNDAA